MVEDAPERCPFCAPERPAVHANALAFALRDRYPVSAGHTLVVPRRHVASWFDATGEERAALLELVDEVRRELDAAYRPSGYNLGVNVGAAAGQTVAHLHLHVIPRHDGDVDDPRGGVRFVIPQRGNYHRPGFVPTASGPAEPRVTDRAQPLATGTARDPFLEHVRPLIERSRDIAILAAFVQDSGVALLRDLLRSALIRGARVRLLTGDYLQITQAQALVHLLAMVRGEAVREHEEDDSVTAGRLELHVVEVESLPPGGRAFHPKAWIFRGRDLGTAFVGSSNLSRSALQTGVEWNLRVDGERDPVAFEAVVSAFEAWWGRGRPIDEAWLADYRARALARPFALPPGEQEPDPLPPLPEPHALQREALAALRRDRAAGRRRALVVMATGLGKTWLAAFDVLQAREEWGGSPRILVLAHRAELLEQAAATLQLVLPEARSGWMAGPTSDTEGDVVFASVMKLGRREHLRRFAPDAFDYVIVDEVHHAEARTWRRILAWLRPRFLLGLTATPERADRGDILGLFDDHVAFEAGLGPGIEVGRLVPFRYFGLKDTVDYAPIPWRNRRFDPAELERAVATEARMERLWKAWAEHAGRRSLVFCCSIPHADHVARWLGARGVRAAAVHSGPASADRSGSLARLAKGELDALCTVDLFNEGVDVPSADRVVMLRPTESPVVFLQQLGRGLRADPGTGKSALTVIDFVGNHKVFLQRVRTLLSLGATNGGTSLREFLEQGAPPELPPGCSVDVELEAIELLRRLLPSSSGSALVLAYRELREARGERPTAGELYRMRYNPAALKAHASWFEFVRSEGDLTAAEARALAEAGDWLTALERRESLTKSFKMVTLQALLDAEALTTGLDVAELADRSLDILRRSPELTADLSTSDAAAASRSPAQWRAYWRRWPLRHWTGEERKAGERAWFRFEGDRFVPRFTVSSAAEEALVALTRELVDYRLAQYRRRSAEANPAHGAAFECRVIHNAGGPIVMLPPRDRVANVPHGDVDVRLPDGRLLTFGFRKVACNVAHRLGSRTNELPDLLRGWFGPAAGARGTDFRVRFRPTPDGWFVEPVAHETVIPLHGRTHFPSWPTLRAAAGWGGAALHPDGLEPEEVCLPGDEDRTRCFAVRASGSSMEAVRRGGWAADIRDGDWLILRWARGEGLASVTGRVALVGRGDPDEGRSYHLKRVVRTTGGFELRSDNPAFPTMPARPDDELIALLVRAVRPESLGPRPGTVLAEDEIGPAFGLAGAPRPPHARVGGHLFLFADAPGRCPAPDRLRHDTAERRPGETAFVLVRTSPDEPWRYHGVARWLDEERAWAIPDLDFSTWRRLGQGRSASRRLEPRWTAQARRLVDELLATRGPGAPIEARGKRCHLLQRTPQGSLQLDIGARSPRTVSLADLGWALKARAVAAQEGGRADEALVNRLRYLDGTPRESTRWIDTGWALVVTEPL